MRFFLSDSRTRADLFTASGFCTVVFFLTHSRSFPNCMTSTASPPPPEIALFVSGQVRRVGGWQEMESDRNCIGASSATTNRLSSRRSAEQASVINHCIKHHQRIGSNYNTLSSCYTETAAAAAEDDDDDDDDTRHNRTYHFIQLHRNSFYCIPTTLCQ